MSTPEVPPKENEFEKLKVPIQNIIAFTDTITEQYRVKCFEVLLNFYLHNNIINLPAATEVVTSPKPKAEVSVASRVASTIPFALRGFLKENNISEDVVKQLFLIEDGQAIATYKIKEQKKATVQIQLALLSAFKNALVDPSTMFEFSVEEVRNLCKDNEKYDGDNFTANFRNRSNLFKDFKVDEDKLKLSTEGKAELVKTIATVSK